MKKLIQRNILPTLMKFNAEHLFRLFTQNKGLNIFYHGVVKQDSTFISPRHITKDQFEQHIKYLKRKFNIISMNEMFEMHRENISPDKWTITISSMSSIFLIEDIMSNSILIQSLKLFL